MSRIARLVWSLVLLASLAVSLPAQTGGERNPSRLRALELLDHLFLATKGFEDDRLKVRIQAQIADALWEADETRGRRLFKEAFGAGNAIVNPGARFELQDEILVLISLRDAALAEALTSSVTESAPSGSGEPSMLPLGRGAQPYLRAAQSLAEHDPGRAAQVARRNLEAAIGNPLLLDVLTAIRLEDPAQADALFRAALEVARRHTSNIRVTVSLFAQYLLPEYGEGVGGSSTAGGPVARGRPNPALVREFLDFINDLVVGDAGTTRGPAAFGVPVEGGTSGGKTSFQAMGEHLAVQPLLPYFDQYLPQKSAPLRARLDQKLDTLPSARERDFVRNLRGTSNPPSVEELLNRAARAERMPEKNSLYLQAAMRASREGHADRALSIADKVSDKRLGVFDIGSQIHYDAAMTAVDRQDAETARRHGRQLPDFQRRVRVFNQIVRILRDKGNTRRAMEVLNETERFVASAGASLDKARGLLSLTAAAARLDPNRGFEIARSAVRAINHLNLTLHEKNPAPESGGELDQKGVGSGLDTLSFEPAFPLLARADFDRALRTSQAIERKEVSTLAQLAACRGILTVGPHR